jgi:hypothetical protein
MNGVGEITKETNENHIFNSSVDVCNSDNAPAMLDRYDALSESIIQWDFAYANECGDTCEEAEPEDDLFEEDDYVDVEPLSCGLLSMVVQLSAANVAQVAKIQGVLRNNPEESFTVFCHYKDAEGTPIITSMFVCNSIEWGTLHGQLKMYATQPCLNLELNVIYCDLVKPSAEFPSIPARGID